VVNPSTLLLCREYLLGNVKLDPRFVISAYLNSERNDGLQGDCEEPPGLEVQQRLNATSSLDELKPGQCVIFVNKPCLFIRLNQIWLQHLHLQLVSEESPILKHPLLDAKHSQVYMAGMTFNGDGVSNCDRFTCAAELSYSAATVEGARSLAELLPNACAFHNPDRSPKASYG
jgi:hypothetical protein